MCKLHVQFLWQFFVANYRLCCILLLFKFWDLRGTCRDRSIKVPSSKFDEQVISGFVYAGTIQRWSGVGLFCLSSYIHVE